MHDQMPTKTPSPGKTQPPIDDSNYNRICAALFVVVWLGSLCWTGLTAKNVPKAGRWFNNICYVANLFHNSVRSWPHYYVIVQPQGGKKFVLNDRDYFSLVRFGHRTRLFRIIETSITRSDAATRERFQPHALYQRQKLAEHIKQQFQLKEPDSPPIESIIFVVVYEPVGESLAAEKGHWQKKALTELGTAPGRLSQHFFDGRDPINSAGESQAARSMR